jgi:hypothetical protein
MGVYILLADTLLLIYVRSSLLGVDGSRLAFFGVAGGRFPGISRALLWQKIQSWLNA